VLEAPVKYKRTLDEVRRGVWNTARRAGATALATELKGSRFALWRNADKLTDSQQAKLAWVATLNGPLYRAWLLKEELRQVSAVKGEAGIALLAHWLAWAARCQIPAFVKLARTIRTTYLTALHATLRLKVSNAIAESTNTKLRVLMRVAFGYRDTEALIAQQRCWTGAVCARSYPGARWPHRPPPQWWASRLALASSPPFPGALPPGPPALPPGMGGVDGSGWLSPRSDTRRAAERGRGVQGRLRRRKRWPAGAGRAGACSKGAGLP